MYKGDRLIFLPVFPHPQLRPILLFPTLRQDGQVHDQVTKIPARYTNQKDDDKLEIRGDTELDQKKEEKTDKSTGKKTPKS